MLLLASCPFYLAFVPAHIGSLSLTILIEVEAATGARRSQRRRRAATPGCL